MMSECSSNSRIIAGYIAGAGRRDLPQPVLEAARQCLVDWVAVCIGALNEPAARIVRTLVNGGATEERALLMLGGRAAAPMAALCNGTLAHCLDFDDTYVPANTHASGPIWAATLALGDELGADEHELLRAFVTGFEVMARVGRGLGEAVTARGFHATGVFGRIGAAAACATLLRLDERSAGHALGAATTQVSGLVGSFGTMSKPYHAGKAAMDGVLAARLAQAGFEAADRLLEPGGELQRTIIQDGGAAIRLADFDGWEVLENSVKPYAACHLTHPVIDAARGLGLAAQQLAGLRRVTARLAPLAFQVTGGKSGAPRTGLEAKFDARYVVALSLHGRTLAAGDFGEPLADDPAVRATAAKVAVEAEPGFAYGAGRVSAELADGTVADCTVPVAKGHPGNPLSWSDLRIKFEGLVEPAAGTRTPEVFERLREFGATPGRGLATLRQLSAALLA